MGDSPQARLDPRQIERFSRELDRLIAADEPVGVAVSGGPDSVALLLLAAAARPSRVEAATVDHALRPEGRTEADFVASLCTTLGIPHRILTADWNEKPTSAVQERARAKRYDLLSSWATERGLSAVLTAHHLDDQAETLVMRLSRGAGVTGLAAMRPLAPMPGSEVPLARPLLGWRVGELAEVCRSAGVSPVQDPSNKDERFERVRVRKAIAEADWLDPEAVAASAAHLAEADEAVAWGAEVEWDRSVEATSSTIIYRPTDAPPEIVRRIVARAVAALASEGQHNVLRGREIDQLVAALAGGGTVTLRGVLCAGGPAWRFSAAPERRV